MLLPGLARWIFATAAGAVLFCTAVNCYTYRVAYPLWLSIGGKDFAAVHRDYLRRLTPVITVPHIVAFFCSASMLYLRPTWLTLWTAGEVFFACTAVIALSLAVAGPVHDRFARTGVVDQPGMQRLIQISAVRSTLMVAASALLLYCMAEALPL